MVLNESLDVVSPDSRPVRRGDESRSETLRRRFVECPQCAEVWLVVGARENDRHVCKGCGHGFAVRFPDAPEDDLPPVGRGGT
jgi:hypothetical protein